MSPGSVHHADQLFIRTNINIWGFPNVVSPLSQYIPGEVCKDGVPREADASGGLDENWSLNKTEGCTFNELHTNAEVEDTKDMGDINDTALTSVKLAKNLGAVHELNGRSDTEAFKFDAYDMFHADKTLALFGQRLSISHRKGFIESTADLERYGNS
ncbi:hypothetical protein LTR66_017086 [Elasticomyces elasticus]|nr:hypothetical protein LTR66_017086 [Elasticomyces elasticus]